MAESPYGMPLEEFEARFRVPVAEQVEMQVLPGDSTGLDWGDGHVPVGDGGAGGDCD